MFSDKNISFEHVQNFLGNLFAFAEYHWFLLLDSRQKFHGTWYSGCCRSNCHFFIYNCCHSVNNFAAFILSKKLVFCYHNCSNVLWEKIVLVWGKKLRKMFANSRPQGRELVMFSRFYFLALEQFFPQLVRNIMVTDYFLVYSYFFQCEEKKWEKFLGYGNNRK